MTSFATTERAELRETALAAGPDAPTLCGDWTVLDLLAHLVVREGDLLAAPGIMLSPLSGLTDRAMAKARTDGLEKLVERFERPPLLSPFRIPAVDRLANSMELFVHHEDIRRAQTDWSVRDLGDDAQRVLWRSIGTAGKALVRPAGCPVSIRWDVAGSERVQVLRAGDDPVVVGGPPGEIALFCFGRAQHTGLDLDGPEDRVAMLREASLGA